MPIIYIESSEWYPVWDLYYKEKYGSEPLEISEKDLAFIERSFKNFEKAQELITSKWEEQKQVTS